MIVGARRSPGSWTGWRSRWSGRCPARYRAEPGPAPDARAGRMRCQRLSGRRGRRRVVLRLADRRLGRKRLFSLTVLIYLARDHRLPACRGASASFALFRLLTGAGIGGEYAAVNADHPGADPGAAARLHRPGDQRQLLDRRGARGARRAGRAGSRASCRPRSAGALAFVIGGVLGGIVLFLRRFIPESPRWLMTHGQPEEAERVVRRASKPGWRRRPGVPCPGAAHKRLRLRTDVHSWFGAGLQSAGDAIPPAAPCSASR